MKLLSGEVSVSGRPSGIVFLRVDGGCTTRPRLKPYLRRLRCVLEQEWRVRECESERV